MALNQRQRELFSLNKFKFARFIIFILFLIGNDVIANETCDLNNHPQSISEVKASVYVNDISEINDVKQEATVDFFTIIQWQDPRLEKCINVDLDKIWKPSIEIVNRRELDLISTPTIVRDGINIKMRQRYYGTLAIPFKLHDFPIDRQLINIDLILLERNKDLAFIIDAVLTGKKDEFSVTGWHIERGKSGTGLHKNDDGSTFQILNFNLNIKRNTSYYIWKVIIPLVIIILMSWSVFWISAKNVAPKISISITSILTLFAYQMSLSNVLPKLAYLTRMDFFVLGAFIIVTLGLFQSITTIRLTESNNRDKAERLDSICRWLFPIFFIIVIIFAFFT